VRALPSTLGVLGIKVSPPLKGGETYLFINQLIIVVSVIKLFLKLTAMRCGGADFMELKLIVKPTLNKYNRTLRIFF